MSKEGPQPTAAFHWRVTGVYECITNLHWSQLQLFLF
uniref:Uncharacterized protein n=1 Tax=Anguilla anguilla TaxID=7936 RepID=A0A0E9QT24_ANGAN